MDPDFRRKRRISGFLKGKDMSIYDKKLWLNNDVQNRTGLRQIVNGGGASSLVLTTTTGEDRVTIEGTWQEIFDALTSGTPVFIRNGETDINLVVAASSDQAYTVTISYYDIGALYTAASADAKPVHIFG